MANLLFEKIVRRLAFGPYAKLSYAQEGEDLVAERYFGGKRDGFYIDIGCHHPVRFSNTYLFYKRGWRGICIDPLPGTRALFSKYRPRDTVIESGIAEKAGFLEYFQFDEPALNTFDPDVAAQKNANTPYKLLGSRRVPVNTLAETLKSVEAHVSREIELMSIDTEGLDLDVLKSNDWQRIRPRLIIAECWNFDFNASKSDPVSMYLAEQGYKPYAVTGNSVFFESAS